MGAEGGGFLVLKRKEGQIVEIVHSASGDRCWFRAYGIDSAAGGGPQVSLAFKDTARLFEFSRLNKAGEPERTTRRFEEPSCN